MNEIKSIQNPKSKIQNRTLWLTENYPPQRGGMSVSCDRIVRSLRENGLTVDVAHFSRRYLKWKSVQKVNGQHFNCPVREDVSDAVNRLWNLVEREDKQERFTHIVAFGGLLPMIAAPVFSKWLKVPMIIMIRGNDFDTGIFSVKRSDILREALANSAAICAVSKDKVEKISALFPENPVVWTPNGIELTEWEFSLEDKTIAEKWKAENVDEGKKVLGLFGQLKRKKGGLFFLENLRRSGFADKFHLLFVGDIETEMLGCLEEHQDLISFTNLDFLDRFELLPFYAACDFVVIPSFYDGMPNVLLESAALGIPSLSSKTGGMLDVLEDRKNSIMFQPGDDFECRSAIETAATIEKPEYDKLSSNCVELAVEFDSASETKKYIEIFNEISNKRSFYAET